MNITQLSCPDKDPEKYLLDMGGWQNDQLIAVRFSHQRAWEAEDGPQWCALYHWQEGIRALFVAKMQRVQKALNRVQAERSSQPSTDIANLALGCEAALIKTDCAAELQPVYIPKPWGREVWYSGIEERGICSLSDGRCSTEIDLVLHAAPRALLGTSYQTPVLLKVLDPHASPELGDLYFELHEEKQEVYIVTHVDPDAWPDGSGAIRMGIDPTIAAEFSDEATLKAAFGAAVDEYEAIRREIDQVLDQRRAVEGYAENEAVMPDRALQWLAELPRVLVERECATRDRMNAFTRLLPLQVGDVVKVPCLTPHSLQHGVRAVEFQTPVYERRILSFNQKVLTQDHWDTAAALAIMTIREARLPDLPIDHETRQYCIERLVEFDAFRALRISIQPGARYVFDIADCYRLLMSLSAHLELDGRNLAAEQAWLLPASWAGGVLHNTGSAVAVALIALPQTAVNLS